MCSGFRIVNPHPHGKQLVKQNEVLMCHSFAFSFTDTNFHNYSGQPLFLPPFSVRLFHRFVQNSFLPPVRWISAHTESASNSLWDLFFLLTPLPLFFPSALFLKPWFHPAPLHLVEAEHTCLVSILREQRGVLTIRG